MRNPLVAVLACLLLPHRSAYGQSVKAKLAADAPLPSVCQLPAGEKDDHRGVDAIQRGLVREDMRFMTLLKSKQAVWEECTVKDLQCSCDMKISENGLGLSCSPREKGLLRKVTQEWHVIGVKELENQFFTVEKEGDDYVLTDLCLAKIAMPATSDKVNMSWQAYNLAGELAKFKSDLRAGQTKHKLEEISNRLNN